MTTAPDDPPRGGFLQSLLRQPLVHFVLIGAAIFGVWKLQSGDAPVNPNAIRIGASELRWLHDTWIAQFGHAPNATEMTAAINGYLDEEMRYREGLALGLDRDDTIVRRRLAQKYDFLLGARADALAASEDDLKAFYDSHPDLYLQPPQASFCQAYYGDGPKGLDAANKALATLTPATRAAITSPANAKSGLPYPACYDAAPQPDIQRDFGPFFAGVVVTLPTGKWEGPVESGYGFHLVRVESAAQASRMSFDTARSDIEADWRKSMTKDARTRDEDALRKRYNITIDQAALKRMLTDAQP